MGEEEQIKARALNRANYMRAFLSANPGLETADLSDQDKLRLLAVVLDSQDHAKGILADDVQTDLWKIATRLTVLERLARLPQRNPDFVAEEGHEDCWPCERNHGEVDMNKHYHRQAWSYHYH